jgi:hypothetical protein
VVLRRNGEIIDSENFWVFDSNTSTHYPVASSKPAINKIPGAWRITDLKPIKNLVVYDVLGRVQYASFQEDFSLDVPTTHLAPGVYFIALTQSDGRSHTAKIWH